MFKRSASRTQRSKGLVRAKQILQILLLLGICFWLVYQVKYSHDKKKAILDEKDSNISHKEQDDNLGLKFGRKELHPRVYDKQHKAEEDDDEGNKLEDDEHEEVEESNVGGVQLVEDDLKKEVDSEEDDVKKAHEEVELEEEEEEVKNDEPENHEKPGEVELEEEEAGLKELEDREQEKPQEEGDDHEEFIDEEKEKEEEPDEKENDGNDEEVKDKQVEDDTNVEDEDKGKEEEADEKENDGNGEEVKNKQVEDDTNVVEDEEKGKEEELDEKENDGNGEEVKNKVEDDTNVVEDEDQDRDEISREAHEAREEHYKGDDASSAVTHDTEVDTNSSVLNNESRTVEIIEKSSGSESLTGGEDHDNATDVEISKSADANPMELENSSPADETEMGDAAAVNSNATLTETEEASTDQPNLDPELVESSSNHTEGTSLVGSGSNLRLPSNTTESSETNTQDEDPGSHNEAGGVETD